MTSRLIIGGRVLGSGKYGGEPKCLCGQPVAILGRCLECNEALHRRRLGLPPKTEAEGKRLAGYLEAYQARSSKCPQCLRSLEEDHDPRCVYFDQ